MKGKVTFLFLMLFLWMGNLKAQELSPCVVVEMKTGEKIEYFLTDTPQLKHNDESVLLTTKKTNVEYETSRIAKVYFSESVNSGIKDIKISDTVIQLFPESIHLIGFSPNESIQILSLNGKVYRSLSVSNDGSLTISLSDLSIGVYIIKSTNQSFKITRR